MEGLFSKFDFKSDFLFQNISTDDKSKVESVSEKVNFKPGEKLFYEYGIPTGVFYIVKGKAKKFKTVIDKQEQIFYIYTAGELLGYHALLSHERYQDSCEALDNLETLFISKDNFDELLNTIPKLKNDLLKNLAHEFGVLANTISILAQKGQNSRLAIFLLVLNHRFNKCKEKSEGISLSRQDLANIIGATRESLGRSLKEFKDMGLIEIKNKTIFIKNELSLLEKIQIPQELQLEIIK